MSEPVRNPDELDRLRADLIAAQGYRAAAEEIAKRRGEMVDALQLRWQRLYGEIDCRIEHGASSNGHLEAVRKMMREVQP
jgi:hypothetical protein